MSGLVVERPEQAEICPGQVQVAGRVGVLQLYAERACGFSMPAG